VARAELIRVFRWLVCIVGVSSAVIALTGTPARADEIRDAQWHLSFLRVAEIHEITRGEGVTVAVIDTGVDASHPDLAGNVLPGLDFVTGGDGRADSDGHGTAMASLIAGHGHGDGNTDGVLGLAPEANILPVRVQPGDASEADEWEAEGGEIAEGIRWAVNQGARVINISLSTRRSIELQEALEYALERNVVVITAAGNTTLGDQEVDGLGTFPGALVVSGTDRQGFFSPVSVRGDQVALAAPAEEIMAAGAGHDYSTGTGTSNATALVSAAAALVISEYPELDAANVINRLIQTADDRGPSGRDMEYGFGVVDPLAALTEDVEPVDENPLGTGPGLEPPEETPGSPPAPPEEAAAGVGGGVLALIGVAIAGGIVSLVLLLIWRTRRARRHHTFNPPPPPPVNTQASSHRSPWAP